MGVQFVKITTRAAAIYFVVLFFLVPVGVTIPWDSYLDTFGTVFIVALAALISFVVCRVRGRTLSLVYAFVTFAIDLWILYYDSVRASFEMVLGLSMIEEPNKLAATAGPPYQNTMVLKEMAMVFQALESML